jgi:hypothetical protein
MFQFLMEDCSLALFDAPTVYARSENSAELELTIILGLQYRSV